MPLLLASPTIPSGGEIPVQCACDSADISPPLTWSGLPGTAKSPVPVVENPDALSEVLRHRTAFDIPASPHDLKASHSTNQLAAGPYQAANNFDSPGHGRSLSAEGREIHRYESLLLITRRIQI